MIFNIRCIESEVKLDEYINYNGCSTSKILSSIKNMDREARELGMENVRKTKFGIVAGADREQCEQLMKYSTSKGILIKFKPAI